MVVVVVMMRSLFLDLRYQGEWQPVLGFVMDPGDCLPVMNIRIRRMCGVICRLLLPPMDTKKKRRRRK
jgi:hypothetical protein